MEGITMKTVQTSQAPAAIGPYSQGIIVNNMFYSSGQIPLTADGTLVTGDIKEQAHQVFQNLQAVLTAAGASFETVVKTTVFIKSMDDFAALNEVYGEYFSIHKPAASRSSKPTTAMSCPGCRPPSRMAWSAASAIRSDAATIAVGRSSSASSAQVSR